MAPTYKLIKSGNQLPKVQLPPVDQRYLNYTGFSPVGWAIIEARPFKESFGWTTSYGRPYVDNQTKLTPTPQTPETLSFKVITYQDLPTNPNSVSTERYVYIGESPYVRSVHENSYIRLVDLVARLGDSCLEYYQADLKAYNTALGEATSKQPATIPFHAWNPSGATPRSVNDEGWKRYYSELLIFENKPSTFERLFIKFCAFASAAISPQKEPYSALIRFFDTEVNDIHLYFRVDPFFDHNDTFSTFKKMVDHVKNSGQTRFSPATYEVVSSTDAQGDWELNKWRVGRHPQDLYDVWVRGDQMDKLNVAGMWDRDYRFFDPIPDIIGKGPSISAGSFNMPTITVVTTLKINSARNIVRKPPQQQVMRIGSNDAARSVWKSSDGNTGVINDAEWLHRSAFSYGGLGESRSSALSSQTPVNLILGTKATNTAMLRVEAFIKRYVLREGAEVVVKTQTQDPSNKLGMLGVNKPWYLAPTLEYRYDLKTLDMSKDTHHEHLKSATRLFHCLDRYTPMRFDFEVGRLAEAEYFGWKDSLPEEEFETEEEDKQNQTKGGVQS